MLVAGLAEFDLKEGPVIRRLCPPDGLSDEAMQVMAFAAFPETLVIDGPMESVHCVRIRDGSRYLFGFAKFTIAKCANERGFHQESMFLLHTVHLHAMAIQQLVLDSESFGHLQMSMDRQLPEAGLHLVAAADTGRALHAYRDRLWVLWEAVLLNRPIAVFADHPTSVSMIVLALTQLIAPLEYCGEWRPYLTIQDPDNHGLMVVRDGIIGVCNPILQAAISKSGRWLVVDQQQVLVPWADRYVRKDHFLIDKLSLLAGMDTAGVIIQNYFAALTREFVRCVHDPLNHSTARLLTPRAAHRLLLHVRLAGPVQTVQGVQELSISIKSICWLCAQSRFIIVKQNQAITMGPLASQTTGRSRLQAVMAMRRPPSGHVSATAARQPLTKSPFSTDASYHARTFGQLHLSRWEEGTEVMAARVASDSDSCLQTWAAWWKGTDCWTITMFGAAEHTGVSPGLIVTGTPPGVVVV